MPNCRHLVVSLIGIGIAIVLLDAAGCAQLPSNDAAENAVRCPGYSATQTLDLEAEWAAQLPPCAFN
jgi:hypothetical protein